jgi:hypothetical protein
MQAFSGSVDIDELVEPHGSRHEAILVLRLPSGATPPLSGSLAPGTTYPYGSIQRHAFDPVPGLLA